MKIVADINIPCVKEAFKDFGEIDLIPGREISNKNIKDADILLVRSVTKVNKRLLEDSKVKFVGTATIGFDHIDRDYLRYNNIYFTSAPGSNANSVAEYIISGLLNLSKKYDFDLKDKKVGIIGVGNVGSRVKKRLDILGIECLLNDPPKKRETNSKIYLSLDTVLKTSDIITVHIPLNRYGVDATCHLINNEFIAMMKNNSILFNTSRGKVMDETAIRKNRDKLLALVLDVWETEPNINIKTLEITDIATPHIAGYSYDGKVRGTEMLYHELCSFLKREENWNKTAFIKPEKELAINLNKSQDLIYDAINFAYPIMNDDKDLREIKNIDIDKRALFFDNLRKNYPKRREFFNYTLYYDKGINNRQINILSNLGFLIK